MTSKLRVGVLLRSLQCQNWAARALQQIQQSDAAEVVSVLLDHSRHETNSSLDWHSALFRMWSKLDRNLNGRTGDAFGNCELPSVLKNACRIEVSSSDKSPSPQWLKHVAAANLDVILALDGAPQVNRICSCAKYGVWYLNSVNNEQDMTAPMFWAAYCQSPVFNADVVAATNDGEKLICRSITPTNDVSLYLGQSSTCWKGGELLVRRLRDLKRYGWDYLQSVDPQRNAQLSLPDNATTAKFLLRWFGDALRYEFNYRVRKDQWFVAYRRNRGVVPSSLQEMGGFRIVTPPRDRFFADPFVVTRAGKSYIFIEDYFYKKKKGLISCIEIDERGECGKAEVVLEAPYHLSYPFVFEHGGEWYMIPETRENLTVELYRAVDFPRRWVLEKVLLKNVPAVDSTVFMHEGRVWLFLGGMAEKVSPNDELFLFSADSLFGDWRPHPRNPIVSDVRSARPAGALFFQNGQLIRPAQDCSTRYGFAVVFNRVDLLSESDYREAPIGRIPRQWCSGNQGTHTFNQNEAYQVVDGRMLIFK